MILNIICLVGILSFANRLQISHCVNTLEVLKKTAGSYRSLGNFLHKQIQGRHNHKYSAMLQHLSWEKVK